MRHAWLALLAVPLILETPPAAAGEADGIRSAPPADGVEALKTEVAALRDRLQLLEEGIAARGVRQVYAPPETLEVAGEAVPLDRWDARERLEREFYLVLGNWGQVVLWLKRSARYFPYVAPSATPAAVARSIPRGAGARSSPGAGLPGSRPWHPPPIGQEKSADRLIEPSPEW